jgi:hypothetical protein
MYTNVNLAAPVGVLLFLATGAVVSILTLTFVFSLVSKKLILAKWVTAALLVVLGGYFAVMLVFSFASNTEVLAHGEEKHFCEIDCHLAYSIVNVVKTKSLGEASDTINAAGTFYVITVQTRFDENTISPRRGNGQLQPNPRAVMVVDENGTAFSPTFYDQEGLARIGITGTPISTPLRPAEAYTTTFVFDLPSNANHPTLLINEADPITHLIIGHENSIAHKKTSFEI